MTAEELEKELKPVAYRDGKPTHFMDRTGGIYTPKVSSGNINADCLSDQNEEKIRKFSTGATRDTDTGKYDYEAFFSPLVLERRAAFMHKNRVQKDGTLRDGDNWQRGIPLETYAKSEFRHHMEFWKLHRGLPAVDEKGQSVDIETAICAAMFNLEGYLFELLKNKKPAD